MTHLRTLALAASLAAAALAPASAQPLAGQAPQPSFSCAAARTPVERAICTQPALAAADREMAELFALARTSAFGTGPSNQLAAQREALRSMRACASADKAELGRCLEDTYADRNAQLATAVLISAPQRALPTLRRIDPGFARVLEATALWAAEPVNADWSAPQRARTKARITALLAPYLKDLLTKEEQSFGRSILTDPGLDGVAVKAAEDLFRSDRHFAAFLNVLGPYLPERSTRTPSTRRALPCAAVIRHPALLQASASVFGSTMDNFVLDNDCAQSLPSTPALQALDEKLNRSWPDCEGTIRYAAYRGYQTALDEARLGRVPHDAKAVLEARRGVTHADITATRRELTDYYARYLGKNSPTAAIMAKDALAAVLSAAHECGT
jgi:uncharacterized protein